MEGKIVATSALVLLLLILGGVECKACISVKLFIECLENSRCVPTCIDMNYTGGHCSNTNRLELGQCVCTKDCEDGGAGDGGKPKLPGMRQRQY
ncbi:unnamed protein product [Urochloa decumbens]|uniref:Uncharacterized protein n=1 Tax=Urochloa decumbens TaxID=240449 RepID=A0ABC9HCP9_9POAL